MNLPMVKLLVIADDFTGALDTGVQFAASGATTQVITNRQSDYTAWNGQAEVLVLDAETRHLPFDEAYRVITDIVKSACAAGISHLYKKTDSALRGNIGSELAAMLDASGQTQLHFVPAFPKHGRTTVGGVQYIDGVPVAQGVFGKDPFEPVRVSAVSEIIALQTAVPVIHIAEDSYDTANEKGIVVYDATTDQRMDEIAEQLAAEDKLQLLAGCAGFAATLPKLLGITGEKPLLPSFDKGLLVACGSVNPITLSQLSYAEKNGFLRIRLTPAQKLDSYEKLFATYNHTFAGWLTLFGEHANCILDANDTGGTLETDSCARKLGITSEQTRLRITQNIGGIVKSFLDNGLKKNLMITGGDTLMGFMQQIGVDALAPVCELLPGTVLSQFTYCGVTYNLLSKSGGFGTEGLLAELSDIMGSGREEKRTRSIC